MRPFRFIAPVPPLTHDVALWRDRLRRLEDLGFSSVAVPDHLSRGSTMEPLVAMSVAAAMTTRLRILSLVLANDFRNPVVLHKSLATLDVLSSGRLEVGLGTGWLKDDYVAAGLAFDSPRERIERLADSVAVLKRLFTGHAAESLPTRYGIAGLDGAPEPVQRPHPPIMLAGGGQRILQLAGREADIAGVHARLDAGALTRAAAADLAADRFAEKVSWIQASAVAAGRPTPELQATVYLCRVTDARNPYDVLPSSFDTLLSADPQLLQDSPAVLVGSVEACVDLLCERRERLGINYWQLGWDVEAVAPIVARLSGS